MSTDLETVFSIPRLNTASIVAGACCPVPAEALIVPELEAVTGVIEAGADWQRGRVWVRHSPEVRVEELAELLEDLNYPAEKWNTAALDGVSNQ